MVKGGKEIAGRNFEFTVGGYAEQADGAVTLKYGDTVVLATCVATGKPIIGTGFLPLTVEYREKTYAAGKIPGGFYKREGRLTEKETISARLIDRALRPLFPKGFSEEVQVVVWTLSADGENDPDFLGISASSCALTLSDIPFFEPVGAVRVGFKDRFILNPKTQEKIENLDIVVAGTEDAIVMVEGRAKFFPDEKFAQALKFAHSAIKEIIALQKMLASSYGKKKRDFKAILPTDELKERICKVVDVEGILSLPSKAERRGAEREAMETLRNKIDELIPDEELVEDEKVGLASMALDEIKREIMRAWILQGKRIDGRSFDDIRQTTCEVGVLPRTHGSSIFKRGETQALVTVTLGSTEDVQFIEALESESFKRFMLHYNFPPFATNEVKPIRGPSRREIGHGVLAERALSPIIPDDDTFPYTIRVVSDILESNGSSSMASVCGGSLALHDAGVPVLGHIAGVGMGLVKTDDGFIILTDILGDEDHVGDMDFKVAGSETGIVAIQMDLKTHGITFEIIHSALMKAKSARIKIIEKMKRTIAKPREHLSAWAPRYMKVSISPDKIGILIGPSGRNIKAVIAATDSKIDIKDDGKVIVFAPDEDKLKKAIKLIEYYTQDIEEGKVYMGRVKKVLDDGVLMELMPSGTWAFLPIAHIDRKWIRKITDVLKVGDEALVKVLRIEADGRIVVSRKAILSRYDEEKRKMEEVLDELKT